MKTYTVYLFICKDQSLGWLAYMDKFISHLATVVVQIEGISVYSVKRKAVILANRGFFGLKIIHKNFNHPHWGINNHPELKSLLEGL